MKRYIQFLSITALALFVFACSNAQDKAGDDTHPTETEEIKKPERPKYDFRSSRWGMSKEEVMAGERAKLIFDKENSVEYRVFIGDYQAQANYTFDENDKLVRVGLYFLKEYEDKNDYITAYEFLKDSMTKGVGSPVIDKTVQLDPSAKIDPEQKGQAICDGKLINGTQWNYPGTDVQLLLRGEEGTCYLTVLYLKNLPEGAEEAAEPQEQTQVEDSENEDPENGEVEEEKAETN